MIKIFSLSSDKTFASQVASFAGTQLSDSTDVHFSDGESYIHSNVNVRGCDVFIVASLYSDKKESINDKLIKLALFIGSLKDASADRITAVIPYMGYARQDRKTSSRAPITTKYMAQLLESVGLDRVLTMDVHNLSALQNSFRIPTDNLEAKNVFASFLKTIKKPEKLVVLSPDSGGMGRAKRFRNALEKIFNINIEVAYLDKERSKNKNENGKAKNEAEGNRIVGTIKGKNVIIIDDMLASGGTVASCQKAIDKYGGQTWGVFVTHGLFVDNAISNLEYIPKIVITDTIPPFRASNSLRKKITSISVTRLFGEAIRLTNEGGSISELIEDNNI